MAEVNFFQYTDWKADDSRGCRPLNRANGSMQYSLNQIATIMKLLTTTTYFLGWCLAATLSFAADAQKLDEHLEPLRPFLVKTWRGEFKSSTPERPQFDVCRWERALNGQAVRVLHSVNDGSYGGESIIFWDGAQKHVVYYYFTTAGFFTTGTMRFTEGKFTSHELVKGGSDGISEVRAVGELLADGKFQNKSEYLKEGKWVAGHEVLYR